MKTTIQLNQLRSSSDYLLNNLFKELVESTTKVVKRAGKKGSELKAMSNNQLFYHIKGQIKTLREYTSNIICRGDDSSSDSETSEEDDDVTRSIGGISQNID